jgi:hypothetical protein
LENLISPSKSSGFQGWKISELNAALRSADGPQIDTVINTENLGNIAYIITYPLQEGEPIEFPDSGKLLPPSGQPYIRLDAQFDESKVQEGISEIDDLIDSVPGRLNGETPPVYTDTYLVGRPQGNAVTNALDAAIKAAQEAAAGEMKTITVEVSDFNENGELISESITIKYHTYDHEAIERTRLELEQAIENAEREGSIEGYVLTSVSLSSKDFEEDKEWKSITIAHHGTYKITIVGANGGHARSTAGQTSFGGYGGYVEAQKEFQAGDVIKVRIGTEGKGTARLNDTSTGLEAINKSNWGNPPQGGWPNGGAGGKLYSNSSPGSGGGGATEVYFAGNREGGEQSLIENPGGLLEVRDNNLLLVAGGGGGAGSIPRANEGTTNMDRGALPGGKAGSEPEPAIRRGTLSVDKKYTLTVDLQDPYTNIPINTGLDKFMENNKGNWYGEYAPNDAVSYDENGTGKGQNGGNGNGSIYEGSGGGGGGYYGGNAIKSVTGLNSGGGGGGSNYVKSESGFTSTANTTAEGYGNGQFKIEYVPGN